MSQSSTGPMSQNYCILSLSHQSQQQFNRWTAMCTPICLLPKHLFFFNLFWTFLMRGILLFFAGPGHLTMAAKQSDRPHCKNLYRKHLQDSHTYLFFFLEIRLKPKPVWFRESVKLETSCGFREKSFTKGPLKGQ